MAPFPQESLNDAVRKRDWVAAVLAGLCMGSSQLAGRALAGAFSPAPPATA